MSDLTGNTDRRHLRLAEAPDTKPGMLYIRMLGDFQVSSSSHTVGSYDWKLRKSAHLVKLLALQPGHRMHREQILDLLWPDLSPKKATNNLYRTLHETRKTLATEDELSQHLQLREGQLLICPDQATWVDVVAFESAATVARNTREPVAYRRALDLYRGELLPDDRYEEWTERRRRELASLRLDLLIELAALYEKRGEHRLSIGILEKVVSGEPAHEETYASLMRLYALSGRRREALEQYERLRVALSRELEIRPDAESKRLFEQIQSGDFPPPGDSPAQPLPSETLHPNNLPVPRTSFIGREQEIRDLKRLLETTRLLTLTGVGGSGKTRLALEVARELLDFCPDGVWMAGLSSISDPELVPQAVARIFGVREQPGYPLAETLAAALRDSKMLLLLDNCEQVVGMAASLAETLLGSCPGLRVLATSRELLNIKDEASWTVPALSLPDPEDELRVEDLQESESVRLFVDRAAQREISFSLTQRNVGSIVKICGKLDGIPLAIELAAARVGLLSVEQISERLEDALQLLNSGRRTAEPRQQTLRGALDWSHDLLDNKEQRIFRRLAVFAGGFTLEVAEKIAADDDISEEEILELLSSLVDKSLVISRDGRHRLLEPVRQYALEKLAQSGEVQEVRRWHANWCVELAERAEPELTGRDQAWWMNRLETEHDNLRAALGWLLDAEESELNLRLASALWMFWHTHGYLSEGRRWSAGALAAADTSPRRCRAAALMGSGQLALFQRDYDSAERSLEESLSVYREIDDKEGIVTALIRLGYTALLGERNQSSIPGYLEEATRLGLKLKDSRTKADVHIFTGLASIGRQDLKKAASSYEEALKIARRRGDTQNASLILFNLGFVALGNEDLDGAEAHLRESLKLSRGSEYRLVFVHAGYGLAGVAASRRLPARAARLSGAVEAVSEATGVGLSLMTTSRFDHLLERARAELGEEAFETEQATGKLMNWEQAIDYTLAEETPAKPLTPREKEIAELVARGLSNRRISEELVISTRTAETHLKNIFEKLNVKSRTEVAERLEHHNL
ncbi:MAG: BTAD domain-containing putative transcriptional regulator [Rubrobacteraceae bacterium]